MTPRGALLAAALLLAALPAEADFTLVTVGDLIISRPLSMLRHPGAFPQWKAFGDALDLLSSNRDLTYGNLETTIYDAATFAGAPYSWDGDWMLSSSPAVAGDLAAMGIGLVSRANNHALDWGNDGMRATASLSTAAGLAGGGTGETLQAATAPAFVETPGGRVAIVSMVSTFRPTTDALAPGPAAPLGRPGANGVSLKAWSVLDAQSYARVAEIACSFQFSGACPAPAGSLELFGTAIRPALGDEPAFSYAYDPDEADVDRIAAAVSEAKAGKADHIVVTIHAHEALTDEAPPDTWQAPAAYLAGLAHRLIDTGADAFVVTGIHHVAGLEIYRGRPIFYGLGNFFWSDIQEPLSGELHGSISSRALLGRYFERPNRVTDSDLSLVLNAHSTFATAGDPALNRTFQTFVARSTFDGADGGIKEIRLYPIDLGYGDKLTRSGVPRRASQAIAAMVLDRIAALSGPALTIGRVVEDGYLIGVVTPR